MTYTDNETVNTLISEYLSSEEIHSSLYVTYKNVFDKVYDRIINPDKYQTVWINGIKPDTTEMKNRLIQEVIDSRGMCFTGRLTRIVNCLVGFYSDINIHVSSADQISAKINIVLQATKDKPIEERKNSIRECLKEIEVEDKVIEEWIANIPDFIEETPDY